MAYSGKTPNYIRIVLSGTAGGGYAELDTQSSNPSAPASGYRLFSDSGANLAWITTGSSFSYSLVQASLTANRSMTVPDYNIVWPATGGTNGYALTTNGSGTLSWTSVVSGTVSSVALTMPSIFSVSGSPVTSTGTFAVTLATELANTVWAGPTTGSAATPTFRTLVAADIPSLSGSYLPLTGGTVSGNIVMSSGATVTGLPTAVSSSDAVNLSTLQSYLNGITWKTFARVATTTILPNAPTYSNGASGVGATLTATAPAVLVIDGITVNLNDRVLVKNQVTTANNGIYSVTTLGTVSVAYVLTRTTDANTGANLVGASIFVDEGTANADSGWFQATASPITMGTTALSWVRNFGSGTYTADGTTITLTGNQFALTVGGITDTYVSSSAAIAVSKLAAGTNTFVLTTVGGVPTWASPAAATSITVGSTTITSGTTGAILYNNAGTLANLVDVATGSYLASGGISTAPLWATLNQAAVAGLTVSSSPTFAGVSVSASTASVTIMSTGTNQDASLTLIPNGTGNSSIVGGNSTGKLNISSSGAVAVLTSSISTASTSLTTSALTINTGSITNTIGGATGLSISGDLSITAGSAATTGSGPGVQSFGGNVNFNTGSASVSGATGTATAGNFVFNIGNATGGASRTPGALLINNGAGSTIFSLGNSGLLTLSTPLPVSSGGVGISSYTTGDLLYALSGSALTKLAIGASTTYLKGGTTPSWATLNQAAVAGLTTTDSPSFATITTTSTSAGFSIGGTSTPQTILQTINGTLLVNSGNSSTLKSYIGASGNNYPALTYNAAPTGTSNQWANPGHDTISILALGGVTNASNAYEFHAFASTVAGTQTITTSTAIAIATTSGAWTFGPSAGGVTHTAKGTLQVRKTGSNGTSANDGIAEFISSSGFSPSVAAAGSLAFSKPFANWTGLIIVKEGNGGSYRIAGAAFDTGGTTTIAGSLSVAVLIATSSTAITITNGTASAQIYQVTFVG